MNYFQDEMDQIHMVFIIFDLMMQMIYVLIIVDDGALDSRNVLIIIRDDWSDWAMRL
jgi:hypothetical protein